MSPYVDAVINIPYVEMSVILTDKFKNAMEKVAGNVTVLNNLNSHRLLQPAV